MASFVLRKIDPDFWARVQTKAAAQGVSIKALMLELLAKWLAVPAIVLAVLVLSACAPSPTDPTSTSSTQQTRTPTAITMTGGTTTASHQALFDFQVTDATGGVSGIVVTLATTAGTLNARIVTTGTDGRGQAILTTLDDATVTARTGTLSTTAEGIAFVGSTPPPPFLPPPPVLSCPTTPSLCPVVPTCPTTPSMCPIPPAVHVALTCTPLVHGSPTPCNVNVTWGTSFVPVTQITEVVWNWGDGLTNSGSSPVLAHPYANAGSYTVFVTVTISSSSLGPQTGSTTMTLTIL